MFASLRLQELLVVQAKAVEFSSVSEGVGYLYQS
jgi:hypothetical protein